MVAVPICLFFVLSENEVLMESYCIHSFVGGEFILPMMAVFEAPK